MDKLFFIYQPILNEMDLVRRKLEKKANEFNSINLNYLEGFLKNHGKLIRPALILLSSKSISKENVEIDRIVNLCVSVELIHCASLIHDDVIDGDLQRRGAPTINFLFGEKGSVILGDILFIEAINILVNFPKEIIYSILNATKNMCIGVIGEIKNENNKEYVKINANKTASFFASCCECGAILSMADREIVNKFSKYGYYFGIIYQILDDILDREITKISFSYVRDIAGKAKEMLGSINDSIYKKKLIELVDFVECEIEKNGKYCFSNR